MDRKRLIVLLASSQLYKTRAVRCRGLVLAYITSVPSTMGDEGK